MKKLSVKQQGRLTGLERFRTLLGKSLVEAGFSTDTAGKVLLAVLAEKGNVQLNYAFNPETKKGVMWGRSSGGAVRLPFPLDDVTAAITIKATDGSTSKLGRVSSEMIRPTVTGFWLLTFNYEYVKPTEPVVDEVAVAGAHLLQQAESADWAAIDNVPRQFEPA